MGHLSAKIITYVWIIKGSLLAKPPVGCDIQGQVSPGHGLVQVGDEEAAELHPRTGHHRLYVQLLA